MTGRRYLHTHSLTDGVVLDVSAASSTVGAVGADGTPMLGVFMGWYPVDGGEITHNIIFVSPGNAAQLTAAIDRAMVDAGHGPAYSAALDQAAADLAEFYATHTDPPVTIVDKEEKRS